MKRRCLALIVLVVLCAACTSSDRDRADKPAPGRPHLCPIDPPDGEEAIAAAIAKCPDRSLIRFPPNRTYHQANQIRLTDRVDVTVDGNGSTFLNASTSRTVNGNWVVLRGKNVTFQNMTAQGTFDWAVPVVDGKPKYTANYPKDIGWETNSGFAFYGTDGGGVRDATARNVWGDGVTTAFDGILDPAVPAADWQVARNLVIERLLVENASRVCLGPTQTINNTFKDSTFRHCWTWGVDAEADADRDGTLHNGLPIDGLRLLNNTFDGVNYDSILAPVGGDQDTVVGRIEIRGNRIQSAPALQICAPSIIVGAYYTNTKNRFQDVIVEDNVIRSFTRAVVVYHVDGGAIRNNTIEFDGRGLSDPNPQLQCSPPPVVGQVVVEDSKNVVVDNNRGS